MTAVHGAAGLATVLEAAADGRFPPTDGAWTVVPQPSPRDAGVLALTAHAVVFTDEDPAWVRGRLAAASPDALAAPLAPRFLTALAERTGRVPGSTDLLCRAAALPGPPDLPLREVTDAGWARVGVARRRRDEVRVWTAGVGVVILGKGVAGRWEVAVEVDPAARGRGTGRALAVAARHLVPGAGVWAQVAVGNAASLRVFQDAGYRPVGAEVLLSRPEAAPA